MITVMSPILSKLKSYVISPSLYAQFMLFVSILLYFVLNRLVFIVNHPFFHLMA